MLILPERCYARRRHDLYDVILIYKDYRGVKGGLVWNAMIAKCPFACKTEQEFFVGLPIFSKNYHYHEQRAVSDKFQVFMEALTQSGYHEFPMFKAKIDRVSGYDEFVLERAGVCTQGKRPCFGGRPCITIKKWRP